MVESWKYYAKWKKSVKKDYIPCFIHMPRIGKSRDRKYIDCCLGLFWEWGDNARGGMIAKGYRVYFLGNECVLKL